MEFRKIGPKEKLLRTVIQAVLSNFFMHQFSAWV